MAQGISLSLLVFKIVRPLRYRQHFALWRHRFNRVGQEWPTYWGKTGIPACLLMRQWPQ
jgi:hypothetical protein